MATVNEVRLGLSYQNGLHIELELPDPVPELVRTALEDYSLLPPLPAVDALPALLEALEATEVPVVLTPEASALRALADALVDQDDAMTNWLGGSEGPSLPVLRAQLRLHQLRGAAFLAFRARALLADEAHLEPMKTMVAAAELARALRGFTRIVIVCSAGRRQAWQETVRALSGSEAPLFSVPRGRRKKSGPFYQIVLLEDLETHREGLQTISPQLLLVDEVQRLWADEHYLQVLRSMPVLNLFALSTQDPCEEPLSLHSLLCLLNPLVAGPRDLWASRYEGRAGKGPARVLYETELRSRVRPFVLARKATALDESLPSALEVRRLPLTPIQQRIYARAYAKVDRELRRAGSVDGRRLEEAFVELREVCQARTMEQSSPGDAPKLAELRLMFAEGLAQNRKVVVFTRWEDLTGHLSKELKLLGIPHVRHYRRLSLRRREQALQRFRSGAVSVLLTTDTDGGLEALEADVLVHLDVPWNMAVLAWRRSCLRTAPRLELVLLAAGTLEEALWARAVPANWSSEDVEECLSGVSEVSLSARYPENLEALREVLRSSPTAPAPDPEDEEALEREEAEEEASGGGLEGAAGVEQAEVVVTAEEAPLSGEAGATGEAVAQDSTQVVQEPPVLAEPVSEEGASEGTGASSQPAAEKDDGTSASDTVEVEVGVPAGSPPPSTEPLSDASGEVIEPPSLEGGGTLPHLDQPAGAESAEGQPTVLDRLEVPLKAANRLLAALPVIGEPLSRANGILWERFSGKFRR